MNIPVQITKFTYVFKVWREMETLAEEATLSKYFTSFQFETTFLF